jgi:hypothetical protein
MELKGIQEMNGTKKILLFVFLLCCGCSEQGRYTTETRVNLPRDLYIMDVDPNDPVYAGILPPLPAWVARYGNSERSLLIYNLACLHHNDAKFNEFMRNSNAKMNEFMRKHADPNDTTDPNDTGD